MLRLHQINGWNVSHKLQKRQLLTAINCVAGLSIFFFGYDQGLMGGVNNARDYIYLMGFGYTKDVGEDRNVPQITNTLLQGGIIASYYLGCLPGALFGGWIGDKIGRIKTIAAGAAWTIVGAALQTSAQNHTWMICGKTSLLTITQCPTDKV
jgi:MFS family permease